MADHNFSEAPASLNLKFRIADYDGMLTLRSETGADLLTKLPAVLKRLGDMGAVPTNGHGGNGPATASGTAETKPCPLHPGETLRRFTKDGRSWWSHRLPDGSWCRGS